jgi:hypothetical protein
MIQVQHKSVWNHTKLVSEKHEACVSLSISRLNNHQPRHKRGFLLPQGNALSSCPKPMTLDTQMTLALLQELLMALRANDADGYKSWLALGIEELGRDVAAEIESEWMVPLLVEAERETGLWVGSWASVSNPIGG